MLAVTKSGLSRATVALQRTAVPSVGAVRNLNLHEYLSMDLMKQHGIATPAGYVANTPEEAENIFLHKLNKGEEYNALLWAFVGLPKIRYVKSDLTSPSLFSKFLQRLRLYLYLGN